MSSKSNCCLYGPLEEYWTLRFWIKGDEPEILKKAVGILIIKAGILYDVPLYEQLFMVSICVISTNVGVKVKEYTMVQISIPEITFYCIQIKVKVVTLIP